MSFTILDQRLHNGSRLIMVPMPHSQAVTFLTAYGVGARDESPESIGGISHFIEHMMFKGTPTRPNAAVISAELESLGAENNARTGYDSTSYFVEAPADKWRESADVLGDMVAHSMFEPDALETERGVIVQEHCDVVDDPGRYIGFLDHAAVFGDTPLGRFMFGSEENIRNCTRAQMLEHIRQHYTADNLAVAVAGNFDPAEVIKYLDSTWDLPSTTRGPRRLVPADFGTGPRAVTSIRPTLNAAKLSLSFQGCAHEDPRLPALEIMCCILGGPSSSRLFQEVREKRSLSYGFYSDFATFQETGYVLIQGGIDSDRLMLGAQVIADVILDLKKNDVTEAELARAKGYLNGTAALGLQDSHSVASHYANESLDGLPLTTLEEDAVRRHAVTADDVLAVARDLFGGRAIRLALIGPEDRSDDILELVANGIGY